MIDLEALIALEERAREEIPFALKYKDLLLELRAARAVIEEAKCHVDTAFILQTVLKEYDEATK